MPAVKPVLKVLFMTWMAKHKKCRNDGMFFLLTNETAEHIAELICAEVTVRQSASQPQDS